MAWPSGKAEACKASIPSSNLGATSFVKYERRFVPLFILATPIGNLKDITFRAVETLKEADLILAEDTRKSQILFNAYGIKRPCLSFHQFNEKGREKRIFTLLDQEKKIVLISDAGTPGICDPGAELIQRCRARSIPIHVLPGPCAAIAAMSLYGNKENHFQFIGFLEKKGKKQLIDILSYPGLTIAYDSPHHLITTLQWMNDIAPNVPLFIARELTKRYEETLEETPAALIAHFQSKKIVGEYVLIFRGLLNLFEKDPKKLVQQLEGLFEINRKEALVAAAKLLNKSKQTIYRDLHSS